MTDRKSAFLYTPRIAISYLVSLPFSFQSVVDKLLKKANVSLVVGTSSWREQFVEAITVSAGKPVHLFTTVVHYIYDTHT